MNFRIYILFSVVLILLAGCQPSPNEISSTGALPWKYGDVRYVDPIDAKAPAQDIIALYTKVENKSIKIRIDFLELDSLKSQNLYIALDTKPGGTDQYNNVAGNIKFDLNWDYLIELSTEGVFQLINEHNQPVYGAELLISPDYDQDNVVISLKNDAFPVNLNLMKLQVVTSGHDSSIISDKTEPVLFDAPSPSRSKILFVFWNTFSDVTPAQTMRSWDGAHSGPQRNRHGLKNLIDAVDQAHLPVFLLDLLNPETLSALDYLNVIPRLRDLSQRNLIGLFDPQSIAMTSNSVPGLKITRNPSINWNNEKQNENRSLTVKANMNFYLLKKILLYIDIMNYYYSNYGYAHFIENMDCELLAFPFNISSNRAGLSLNCKRDLLLNALINNPSTPLLFGGDFANSSLGDQETARLLFAYINSHPWIQVMSGIDVEASLRIPGDYSVISGQASTSISQAEQPPSVIQQIVYQDLVKAPNNKVTVLAMNIYDVLTQPAETMLSQLRSNYVGQLGYLIAAANWPENTSFIQNCDQDLDYDGKSECILSTNDLFMIIEPEGGYVPILFSRDINGPHQIISPTWEFIVGISDQSSWDLSNGLQSDPQQMLGAFEDENSLNMYVPIPSNNGIALYDGGTGITKSFRLTQTGLHLDISNRESKTIRMNIPLSVDPWLRYQPGWGKMYSGTLTPPCFTWIVQQEVNLQICSSSLVDAYAFNDTYSLMSFPENPNFSYSRGHYLPFPMAVAELESNNDVSLDITITP